MFLIMIPPLCPQVAGRVHVHPWSSKPGRLGIDVPAIAVHKAAVLDMEFAPLFQTQDDNVSYLATCGDDGEKTGAGQACEGVCSEQTWQQRVSNMGDRG